MQYSLSLALTELGFPCLHTQHLYESPDILEMWAREVFVPSLQVGEAGMGNPDFKLIASHGWRATADLPMALYYEQILKNIFTASLFYQQETILKFGSAPGIYSQKPSLSPL